MRNTLTTIACCVMVVIALLFVSYNTIAKQEESSARVAHLEGRTDELEKQVEQLNSDNASLTDAIQKRDAEIASLTNATKEQIKQKEQVTTEQSTTESTTEEQSKSDESMVFSKTKADDEDGVFDVSVADEYKDAKEEIDESDVVAEEDLNYTYLGVYELTAYEYTGNCCADGSTPTEWWSVACNDPALFHKKIYIEGYGEFWVCDTGGMPSYNILDLYLGDYNSCIEFGRRSAKVWLCE